MNIKIQKEYLKLLKEFVSLKTVSTDPSFKSEMVKAISWLEKLFKTNGFKVNIIKSKNSNPVIIANHIINPSFKTILVYGHYDVQPAQKDDGWKSDPFDLVFRKKRYIARGVIDNKGQILAHIVSVFDTIKKNELTSNVTFIIEGNEESGNPDLAGIIEKYKKILKCDAVLISDGDMCEENPALDVSFRGGGNIRIVYTTSANDHHSGLYGGFMANAPLELATLLSKIKRGNKVMIESFYKEIKENNKDVGLVPTIEISGLNSGYTGNGFKNIIPGKAEARLNVRTVHPQSTSEVMNMVEEFIRKETPAHVDLHIEIDAHCDPISLDTKHDINKPIVSILEKIHGKKVLHQYSGGSIPVVSDFISILKKPLVLVPLSNKDCNMHGVDENFSEYHMKKALEFASILWRSKI